MQKVSPVFIDWMTAVDVDTSSTSFIRHKLRYDDYVEWRTAYHRQRCIIYSANDLRHYFSQPECNQPSIYVWDGSALTSNRFTFGNDYVTKMVAQFARYCSHFTRIDLSVDVFDNGRLARRIAEDVQEGGLVFGRRKVSITKGIGLLGGTTTYIGKRSSPLMLRIYDKSAESKGKIPASRIEFEVKGDRAKMISYILGQPEGWLKATPIFCGLLKEVGGLSDTKEIEHLIYGEVITIEPSKHEPMMEKKEWLRKQVWPSFDGSSGSKKFELLLWAVGELNRMVSEQSE